jgi:hypothetical protein
LVWVECGGEVHAGFVDGEEELTWDEDESASNILKVKWQRSVQRNGTFLRSPEIKVECWNRKLEMEMWTSASGERMN